MRAGGWWHKVIATTSEMYATATLEFARVPRIRMIATAEKASYGAKVAAKEHSFFQQF
jgi:hypothetical protein